MSLLDLDCFYVRYRYFVVVVFDLYTEKWDIRCDASVTLFRYQQIVLKAMCDFGVECGQTIEHKT